MPVDYGLDSVFLFSPFSIVISYGTAVTRSTHAQLRFPDGAELVNGVNDG